MGLPGTLLSLCLCTGWPDFCCSFHCAFLTHIWYEHIAPCSVVRSCTNMCAFLVTRAFSAFKRAVGDFTVWHDQMAFTYLIFSGWQTFVFLQSKTVIQTTLYSYWQIIYVLFTCYKMQYTRSSLTIWLSYLCFENVHQNTAGVISLTYCSRCDHLKMRSHSLFVTNEF